MKNIRTSIIAALVLSLSAFGSGQSQDPPDPEDLKLRFVERQIDDINEKQNWEIIARIPELRLEGDIPAAPFNAEVRSIVSGETVRFSNAMSHRDGEETEPRRGPKYFLNIGYSEVNLDENVASIILRVTDFTGGAHPNHRTRTLNYDIKQGKVLELRDIFNPEAEFVAEISKQSIDLLLTRRESDSDTSWIRKGAGPDISNFASWNLTKGGLQITFDPYQVGPYSSGSFEAVIPYERFSEGVRGKSFYLAESTAYIDGSPPNWCRGGRWTISDQKFSLARVKGQKNARAYFSSDERGGPGRVDGRLKRYVIAGDEVIVKREYGDFSCVWFQPAKGGETVGWLRSDQIEKRVDASRPPFNWIGKWHYALNDIEIKETAGGKLYVYGTALWKGFGDNVHIGEIDYLGEPAGIGPLLVGDGPGEYDCRVSLNRLGKYLIVSDNMNCGGMNVTFNGVYLREASGSKRSN